jgi:hypothetical protein
MIRVNKYITPKYGENQMEFQKKSKQVSMSGSHKKIGLSNYGSKSLSLGV